MPRPWIIFSTETKNRKVIELVPLLYTGITPVPILELFTKIVINREGFNLRIPLVVILS